MAQATWPADKITGGVALKAAGLVAADNNTTAVVLGKGAYALKVVISAIETASADEFYNIVVEANTASATSTYYEIGSIGAFGAAAATGRAAADEAGTIWRIVENPLDYGVRITTYVNGTVATGINFTVDAYPLNRKA